MTLGTNEVWQCSGRVKVLPCSRVAHLERHHKPYSLDLSIPLKQNALRVAEIWMDEYKDMVYMAWNIPLQLRPGLEQKQRWMKEEEVVVTNSRIDFGDVSSRMELQKKLKCKTFDWYLKNVYPVLKPIHSTAGYGRMKNPLDESVCLDQGAIPGKPIMYYCHQYSSQNVYYHLTGEVYVGTLIAETDIDDCCLTHPGKGEKPTLEPCSKAVKNRLHNWDFKPGRAVLNRTTKRCVETKRDTSGGYTFVLQTCTTQVWTLQYTAGNWGCFVLRLAVTPKSQLLPPTPIKLSTSSPGALLVRLPHQAFSSF
ncbi:LOW QUALITY PROTEIN: putative polypeptide N-acetylgalactosaminyltransferase 8 [Megaptera novaeangliae]